MSPYRDILCPIDFSDLSRRTLRWSLEFATRFDAALTVIHVIDTVALRSETLFSAPDSPAELKVRADEQFHALGRKIDLSRARLETVEGAPAEAIASQARERGSDLVIMGTHGWSGVQRLLLGSVTEKVLHRVDVPLLAVTPGAVGKAEAEKGPSFETIVVAVDLGPDAQAAVRHALWLAEKHGARLIASHVVPIPYVVLNERTLERLSAAEYSELEKNLTETRREQVSELLPESSGVEVEISTRVGSVFESLREEVTERKADLVVMGAGGHGHSDFGWLGSTCHKMVRLGACPVLVAR